MFAATPAALSFMPRATLRMSGRFFWRAAESFAPAWASPENETFTPAGEQVALALSFASHLPWQSAETFGPTTLPEQVGAFILTSHEPVQVPEHLPLTSALQLTLQVPPHLPEQEPLMLPEHLPSHLPLQTAPFESLPSHLPSHLPSQVPDAFASHEPEQSPLQTPPQVAPAWASQVPEQLPSQPPESSPPSHLTSADGPLTDASHEAAQSAAASTDTPHFGGVISTFIEPAALASAFALPRNVTAALQAASAFLPGPSSFGARSASVAPRSFARPEQPVTTSASIEAARPWSSATALRAPLTFASTSAATPNDALAMELGSFRSAEQLVLGTPGRPPGSFPQFISAGLHSIATRNGHDITRFETIF